MPRDNVDELDAFADFPTEHWRKIWSANGLYRVIREIKAASMSSVSSQRTALLRLTARSSPRSTMNAS